MPDNSSNSRSPKLPLSDVQAEINQTEPPEPSALEQVLERVLPQDLPELERRVLRAVMRGGVSMEEIAEMRPSAVTSPEAALRELEDGNARFFSGEARRPEVSANERRAQIIGQTPFAAVLACSDSRVPVELVFDQGLGDLFVVRVAGNVAVGAGLGTLEYAIRHLGVRLLVVMGHEGCGAVSAAMLPQAQIDGEPEHLRELIGRIQPSVQGLPAIRDKKARMREAVLSNVRYQAAALRAEALVAEAEATGQLRVVGAYYEIGSGAVDFLTEEEELRV